MQYLESRKSVNNASSDIDLLYFELFLRNYRIHSIRLIVIVYFYLPFDAQQALLLASGASTLVEVLTMIFEGLL